VGTGVLGGLLAATVGPTASAILDPVARTTIAASTLAAERGHLATGLGWIYLILLIAAVIALVLAVRLIPAMRIVDSTEGSVQPERPAAATRSGPRPAASPEVTHPLGEP
jgi:hypothetical protein